MPEDVVMRTVESFELVLSGNLPINNNPDQLASDQPISDPQALAPEAGLRLLLTFDAADRLHIPRAVISARLDTRHRRFVILFEDSAHREELAFPVTVLDPNNNNTPDPDAWVNVLKMIEPFEHLVVVGLSAAAAADAAANPAQDPPSPAIVVFGDVPLIIEA